MPAFINAMDNAILRASMPREKGNPAAYGNISTLLIYHYQLFQQER